MNRHHGLLNSMARLEQLEAAFRRAFRGKRRQRAPAAFYIHLEQELPVLQRRLLRGDYEFSPYRLKLIRVPKKRVIAAAPFRDRVVHHAIHGALEPVFAPSFIHDTYACLPGRGGHRAVFRFQQFMRRWPFVIRLDVVKYFPSCFWDSVLSILWSRIADRGFMELMERLLSSAAGLYDRMDVREFMGLRSGMCSNARQGLPIGNLTSQFFGNLLLDGLDQYCKRTLKIPGYIRYMDDIAIFAGDRGQARFWAAAAREWLLEARGLELHADPRVLHCRSTSLVYLGYHLTVNSRRIRAKTLRRLRAKTRLFVTGAGRNDHEAFLRSLHAYAGLALV